MCSCALLHCFQGFCYFRSVPRSSVLTVCKCASVGGGNHKTPLDTVLLQFLTFCNKMSITIKSTTIYQIITNYLYLFHKMSIFGAPISIQNSHAKYCNTVQYRYFSTHLYHLCCVPVPIRINFFFLSMKTESRAHECDEKASACSVQRVLNSQAP